jgi:NADPH:quinone reductase-like Zn-dependent oxidoreductase
MQSVVLPAYNKNVLRALLSLSIKEVANPVLNDDEVLIKTHAASCNPSDIAFIQGVYNIVKSIPAIPGFEGAGTIVETGKNTSHLLGKKVSAFVQSDNCGTWSEFFVAKTTDIIPLNENMDMDQAACFTVNPFTAFGMYETAVFSNANTIIQNASGGQVAGFIRKMAMDDGREIIDIVRKKETAESLIAKGAKYVLVETDDEFDLQLKELTNKLKPTVAFDAVGGNLSGKIYNSLAPHSDMIIYGGLSNKPISDIAVMDAIFDDKIISGFNLIDWKNELFEDEFEEISQKLQHKFTNGEYQTKIQSSIKMKDIVRGLKTYLGNMSAGKLLINP